jgi:ABC-2 type transport system permease protein
MPAAVMNESLSQLAGTGSARFQQFRAQVWQWVLAQRAFFTPKVMRGERMTSQDYDALPRFQWQEITWLERLKVVSPISFGMALPLLLLLVWSRRTLRKFYPAG